MDDNRITSFRKSKWNTFDPEFAMMIKNDHPEIWRLGGNIKGNEQFSKLYPIFKRGGTANSDSEINALELREAWVARHAQDFRIAGVIAQIKWLAVGTRGEKYMKDLVREEIAKKEDHIEHFGVKGMRWGVRKDSGGQYTRYSGGAKHLSDHELQTRLKRLEAEKRYRDLNKRQAKSGEKFASKILTNIGDRSLTAVGTGVGTAVGFYVAKRLLEKKLGGEHGILKALP